MDGLVRSNALAWADVVLEGTFFLMQNYLTDVWKLSFFNAAAFLNIWAGICRILPLFFLLFERLLECFFAVYIRPLRKCSLVNFIMEAVSGIFSVIGLVLITYTTLPGYRCHEKGEAECVGRKEKALFITGMAFIGVGRATRFVFSPQPSDDETQLSLNLDKQCCGLQSKFFSYLRWMLVIFFFVTPALAFFAFPYVKRWYFLFGVSAICMVIAIVSHLSRFPAYEQPVSDPVRVIKQALKTLFPVFVKEDDTLVPFGAGDLDLSFHGNIVIHTVLVYSSCIVCGMVSSIGNTYFVQQATHMNYNIGEWKPPLQILQLIFLAFKLYFSRGPTDPWWTGGGLAVKSVPAILFSVICCAVAAAVERRSVHAVRRHGLVDKPDDVKTPMSAFWLLFQICFLGMAEAFMEGGLSNFHKEEKNPKWMKRYGHYLGEAVSGLGYMCGVLSVFVVGKISETGGGKGWFQQTLNRSRLDRYYWVLAAFTAVYLVVYWVVFEVATKIAWANETGKISEDIRQKAIERERRR